MVNNKSCGRSRKETISPLPLFSIDDCLESVPAAGNRNGTSLNNAGENGNYWSSTPNEDNSNNAYNLNFNSSNHNVNNNNRNNGHTVRPVSELTQHSSRLGEARHFSITREQLLTDLYKAYKDARKNKRGKAYQLKFEFNLEDNLVTLRDELYNGTYKPLPSTCFIIHDPKMREVFAADFRDRIVHHLFYNYTHVLLERTFIHDSYSCIKGRGTHYGIKRLKHHIRSVSAGYSKPCYVLQIDIRGYFMSIDRQRLLSICRQSLESMRTHESDVKGVSWGEKIDYAFVDNLLEEIVMLDPTDGCIMLGDKEEWEKLPEEKSILHAKENCGLPIGNLSSQLFSNVYMNVFDQFVKRQLGCLHYGRYVDDAYIVADSRSYLKSLLPPITEFLRRELRMELNNSKTHIRDVRRGVEFLGAYIMPFRTYVSSSSVKRIKKKLYTLPKEDAKSTRSSVNSLLGVLSHYDSYNLRRVLFGYRSRLNAYGRFSRDWLTYIPYGLK